MILPRVFASSLALAASSLRARPAVACAAAKHTLPSSVLDQQGAALSEAATTQQLGGKRVALYFSAGWCPMCTSFEPSLQQFLQASEDSGKPCSLIYVPSDRTEAEALKRAKGLGLLSVPFEEADALKKQFKIWAGAESMKLGPFGRRSGVPALVVLSSEGEELAFVPAEAQGVRALQSWPMDDPRGVWQ